MWLVPPTIALTATGVLIVAGAMVVLAKAIGILGNLGVDTLVKGLVAMAGALIILAIGLTAMTGTLAGSAALLVASVALALLAPTLAFLGTLDWGTIFKGLGAVALALGTLAIAGLLAGPGLVSLGVSLLPLAGVFLLTATAVFIFAKALSLLAGEGGKGVAVMVTALTAFVAAIPTLVITFVKGLLSIVDELTKLTPKVLEALGKMLDFLIAFVRENAPKLAIAIGVLVDSILMVLIENVPKIQAAGMKLLLGLLNGISQNITQVVTKVGEIVTKFLNALAMQMPKITQAGGNLLVKFLAGIAVQIPRIIGIVAKMITLYINSVASHIPKIVASGANLVIKFINSIATQIPRIIAAGTNLILKFMDGIGDAIPRLVKKGLEVAAKFLNGIADGLSGLANVGFRAIIRFLNGLERSIRENFDDLFEAGAGVADAIIDGLVDQFGKLSGLLKRVLDAVFGKLPGWAKKILGIHSPSSVFMEIGKFTMQGFAKGVDDNAQVVRKSGEQSAVGMINQIKNILGVHSPSEVMREIGKEVGKGFAQGIHGSTSDIRSAFGSMRDRLNQDIKTTRDELKSNTKQLEEELGKSRKEQDPKLIRELQASIRQGTADLNKMNEARRVLNQGLKEEKQQLIGLSKDYEKVTKKLEAAQQALDEATRARDEAQKSYTDQYSQLPDIDKLMSDALADAELTEQQRQEKITKIREDAEKRRQINQVENYKKALQAQIEATRKYNETLQKLRALGLDDATYKKLLAKGIEGQEFADQLLQAGKPAIDEVNRLDAELLSSAANLAKEAAANLYQAGVDAAQGLVDGLKAKRADLQKEMDNLADMMVRSIKRQLKIKSPSEVFAEVGKFISQGLVRGLDSSDAAVAAAQLGKDTLSAISSAITDDINVDPVITPVLDLSKVQKEARNLEGLTNVTPITAAASFGQAAAISTEKQAVETAATGQAGQAGTTFEYTQNNYSPEKLTDVEIYRQTKNQLAQVKSALGLVS